MAGHSLRRVEDPDDQIAALLKIVADAEELDDLIARYLARWPSGRVANAKPHQLILAMRREIDAIEVGRQAKDERAARFAADQEQRTYDGFTVESAKKLGVTPARFLEIQEERRGTMARIEAERKAKKP